MDIALLRLPWSITLRAPADLLRLEDAIRAALQCEGTGCAVLQSAEYARLKIELRHMLLGRRRLEATRCVLDPTLNLEVAPSANDNNNTMRREVTLTLRTREPALELEDPRFWPPPKSEHEDEEEDEEEEADVLTGKRRKKKGEPSSSASCAKTKKGLVGQPSLSRRFHGLASFEAQLLNARRRGERPTRPGAHK